MLRMLMLMVAVVEPRQPHGDYERLWNDFDRDVCRWIFYCDAVAFG